MSPAPQTAAKIRQEIAALRARARVTEFLGEGFQATVNVQFHVITDDAGTGALTRSDFDKQLAVLNSAFRKHGFTFAFAGQDLHVSAKWFRMQINSQEERDAKQALGIDQSKFLNIYICEPRDRPNGQYQELLGFSSYPDWAETDKVRDGVVLRWKCFPGKGLTDYDEGDTAVHEIGHYLGLYHTFAPDDANDGHTGCDAPGDEVADTPAEQTPNFSETRPNVRDTCPTEGKDPIENYMDYSYDRCMNHFTAGQRDRMRALTLRYRAGFVIVNAQMNISAESIK